MTIWCRWQGWQGQWECEGTGRDKVSDNHGTDSDEHAVCHDSMVPSAPFDDSRLQHSGMNAAG